MISFFLSGPAHRRPRHHGQHLGDAAVGDVALLAVKNEVRPSSLGAAVVCTFAGVGAGFRLGQRECAELFAVDNFGSQRRFCSSVPNSKNARMPIE